MNEARVSFFRNATYTNLPGDPSVSLKSLGFVTGVGTLGIVPAGPEGWEGVPNVSITDFSGFGRATYTRQTNNTWHVADTVSKILDRHTHEVRIRRPLSADQRASIHQREREFQLQRVRKPASASPTSCWALPTNTFRLPASGGLAHEVRRSLRGGFVPRCGPNLTINYGLRWEFSMPWYDTQDRIETLVPGQQSTVFPTAPKGWLVPGDAGIPRTLAPTDYNNFNPRLGIAWSPAIPAAFWANCWADPGKTSIRASSGVFTTAIEDATLFIIWGDAPYGMYWVSTVPPLLEEPFRNRSDGVSQGQRFPFILPTPGDPALKDHGLVGVPADLQFSGILEGQPAAVLLPLEFHDPKAACQQHGGQRGIRRHGRAQADGAIRIQPGRSGFMPEPARVRRGAGHAPSAVRTRKAQIFTRPDGSKVFGTRGPFGYNFGSGNGYEVSAANSSYNSLQATLERRASGFTFLAAYTFSKSMDNASGFSGMNFLNFNLSRALSSFDITHNFVASYSYEFPFDRLFPALRSV